MLESESLPRAVLFVDRGKLQFFGSSVSGVATVEFPPNVVSDLEVINQDAFNTLIKTFVEKNKINSCPIVIVLSDSAYFFESVATSEEAQEKAEIQQFFDAIPFESIRSKVYKAEKGYQMVAVNREFCEFIMHGFEQYGFIIDAVVPMLVLGKFVGKKTLDAELGKFVLSSRDLVRKFSLFAEEDMPHSQADRVGTIRRNQRQMILIIVFMSLLVVLGALVVLQFTSV